jgi:asparagine synthetase A
LLTYPNLTTEGKRNKAAEKFGAIFIIGIGGD